jgi:hypothetical protein
VKILDQEFELVREGRYLCRGCRAEFNRRDAIRHLSGRICPDVPIPYDITLTGRIYAHAIKLAHTLNQTVGRQNDYYVTLEQLEHILQNA